MLITPDAASVTPATATTAVRRLNDSSKTRVGPILGGLTAESTLDPQWLRRLLDLATGPGPHPWHEQDLSVAATDRFHAPISGAKTPKEKGLYPPVALLSWLIRNFPMRETAVSGEDEVARKRKALARREPAVIAEGLRELRRTGGARGWHVLEGPTYPDGYFITPDALIVIEGKRTETGMTTDTTWMPGRHQMLRHLDAAWEIRGDRVVYGLAIVECPRGELAVPEKWAAAARATQEETAVAGSLPHRGPEEQAGIRDSFLGMTTWAQVVSTFGLPASLLG